MAAPTCGTTTILDRNGFRTRIDYDINDGDPIWAGGPGNPNLGAFTWVITYSTTPGGPYSAAPLANIGDACTDEGDNRVTLGGPTQTIIAVGGSASPLVHDQDYYVLWSLRDETDTEVFSTECGPVHTPDYPDPLACLALTVSNETATAGYGDADPTGQFNVSGCRQDSVVWEISTTPGGPYTPEPSEGVTSFSPTHNFTGLSPNTTYYYRGRFTEVVDSNGEFLVGPECSFTTVNIPDPFIYCGREYSGPELEFCKEYVTQDGYRFIACFDPAVYGPQP